MEGRSRLCRKVSRMANSTEAELGESYTMKTTSAGGAAPCVEYLLPV